ncbi:MAG: hypothetical protein LW835_15730 [Burkholderiaceae bacterium]|nr:hypothetical protein [Burkholderiaceae bacterium]
MNVPDALRRLTPLYGDAPALICGSEHQSYAQLDERSNRLANALLASGLRRDSSSSAPRSTARSMPR